MLNSLNETLSRRTVAVAGTGVAAGLLATPGRDAAAQDAMPEVGVATPGDGSAALGYVSMRMRPYETEEAANESTDAARVWAIEHLVDYTDGNPEVINATVVYADMPIFER